MTRPLALLVAASALTSACATNTESGVDTGTSTYPPAIARCDYRNAFTSAPECKDYWGDTWTVEAAAEDCETGIVGGAGTFVEGSGCDISPLLGTCTVNGEEGLDYTVLLGGDTAEACTGAELACTTFAAGEFTPEGVCLDATDEDGHTVFIWPYETCEEPVDGEAPGDGPDGTVCTWNLISGATEEGRDYRDYGSCDVVFTNRPYYPVEPYATAADDDPRLSDEAYLAELAWVTEQATASACVCCHSSAAPEGPAIWGIDSEVLWPDMMSDTAVGMFAGYVDSSALGAFPPEENNGFNRTDSAMPTTDPERMVSFWQQEMDRRGLSAADMADEPPVGQALLDQLEYKLPSCEVGEGVAADGTISWTSDQAARYLYILEEGSTNPGLPPNFDMPDGVIWRIDVPYDGEPMKSGFAYGSLPRTVTQVYPAPGTSPVALEPGKRYHLYALYDVALPIARCVFEVPEERGCATVPTGPTGAWAAVLGALAWSSARRRRTRDVS